LALKARNKSNFKELKTDHFKRKGLKKNINYLAQTANNCIVFLCRFSFNGEIPVFSWPRGQESRVIFSIIFFIFGQGPKSQRKWGNPVFLKKSKGTFL